IPEYQRNGAYIRGASTVESDVNGWATFTVVVDENLRGQDENFAHTANSSRGHRIFPQTLLFGAVQR
ncbi:MAG: hypothetical protein RR369_05420, partial [Lachnospiraceae bacterium]